jgi:hypothetical protein
MHVHAPVAPNPVKLLVRVEMKGLTGGDDCGLPAFPNSLSSALARAGCPPRRTPRGTLPEHPCSGYRMFLRADGGLLIVALRDAARHLLTRS